MLVIDDAKAKLLKMKERLLRVSNDSNALAEYKELAQELDREVYDGFVSKIKDASYNDLPLEEQLELFNEIIDEYDNLVEFQCGHKNVYESYAHEELELSDLNNIYVDNIKKRISDIEGFLYNANYLENGKCQLDKLNVLLIDADKKREYAEDKFKFLEDELINNFISAEGRINLGNNEIGYTSILDEYKNNGINIKDLFEDERKLEKATVDADKERQADEEKLVVADICYHNDPSSENKDIYDSINADLVKARYILVIYRMAAIVNKRTNKYYEMIEKRRQLKYLNIARINCLSSMGISFTIDPFSRLKINDQLKTLETFEYDPEEITVLRKKISNLTEVIEERTEKDKYFRTVLAENVDFVKPKDVPKETESVPEEETPDLILNNQVVSVKDFLHLGATNRIKEKTDGVVKRVYELFSSKGNIPTVSNPKLIVEEDAVNDEEIDKSLFDDEGITDQPDESLFEDIEIESGNEETIFDAETDDGIHEELFNDEAIDNEVFQEVKPFEEASLFSSRYDNGDSDDIKVEEEKDEKSTSVPVEEEPSMPDAFWVTQEDEKPEANDEELSFDEQVEALVGE